MIELELFKEYLDEFLTKEFIVFFSSFLKASILFIKKSKNDLKILHKLLKIECYYNQKSIFNFLNKLIVESI
jgi:hypothetical protein